MSLRGQIVHIVHRVHIDASGRRDTGHSIGQSAGQGVGRAGPPSIDERADIYDRLTAVTEAPHLADAHASLHRVLTRIERSLRQASADVDYTRLRPQLAPTVLANVQTWASLALYASSTLAAAPDRHTGFGDPANEVGAHNPVGSNAPPVDTAEIVDTLERIITLLRTPFAWASIRTLACGSNLGAGQGQDGPRPHHRLPHRAPRRAHRSSRRHGSSTVAAQPRTNR